MQGGAGNAAIAANYDAIAYDALPYPLSNPDHVAAVATMFGLDAPRVATARVLEVGCNDGSNLLPLAATRPAARFVGCDIASAAIESARATAQALGLTNVEFVQADLASMAGEPFDYIIAHGVYSWVPAPVREALMALAGRALSRDGLAYVSYNTYPGGFVRRAAWETLRWHVRGLDERAARLKACRELAALLADAGPTHEAADASLREEFRRIASEPDSPLFHDTIAEPNDPVWFHELVEHAARHGLDYVAEALPSMMAGAGLATPVRKHLATLPRLAREQYLDFARVRRFRQSILCRRQEGREPRLDSRRLASLHVSASMPLLRAAAERRLPTLAGADGPRFARLLELLADHAPAAMPVSALVARVPGDATPGARSTEALLLEAWIGGVAQLHVAPVPVAQKAGTHPRVYALARRQSLAREAVTNLRHETIRIADPVARALAPLCDGARDRQQLAQALAEKLGGTAASLGAPLTDALESFAQCALLEPEPGDA